MKFFKLGVVALLLVISSNHSHAQKPKPALPPGTVRNIVLVHGAFVDGSGWKGAYEILKSKGYHVSVTQQPLTSYEADVAAVKRVIDQQDGPCILVAHSYGGAVITTAGNDSKVVGLVYVAAHAPDKGESEANNGKKYPPAYKSLIVGKDGLDYIDPKTNQCRFGYFERARLFDVVRHPRR